jgi:hypothetical protein
LPDSGSFAGLALHSVVAPNEELANKNRTALTREKRPRIHAKFKRIPHLFFRIRLYSFGVQNGVHFQMIGKNFGSFQGVSEHPPRRARNAFPDLF